MTGALAVALLMLAWLARRRLSANGYSSNAAFGIAACFLAVSSVGLSSANGLAAVLLGCGIYAVCASTFSLVREQSVRGIIRAGGALAGAQAVVPFGGLFILALLPALIGLPRSAAEVRKSLGVLLLLLFMPAVAAVVLTMTNFRPHLVASSHPAFIFGATLLLLFPALVATGFRSRQWTSVIPLLVGFALLIAISAGNATGEVYRLRDLVPALASIVVVSVSEWPASEHHVRRAFALFAVAIASTWAAFEAGYL